RVALRLTKRIPVAAGLGGGSADAAATLQALIDLWRVALPVEELFDLAARLGADVPMCLAGRPALACAAAAIVRDPAGQSARGAADTRCLQGAARHILRTAPAASLEGSREL